MMSSKSSFHQKSMFRVLLCVEEAQIHTAVGPQWGCGSGGSFLQKTNRWHWARKPVWCLSKEGGPLNSQLWQGPLNSGRSGKSTDRGIQTPQRSQIRKNHLVALKTHLKKFPEFFTRWFSSFHCNLLKQKDWRRSFEPGVFQCSCPPSQGSLLACLFRWSKPTQLVLWSWKPLPVISNS